MSNLVNRTNDGKVIHQNDNINESSASDITEMNKGKSNKVQAKFFKYDWAAYVFLIIIIVVTVLGHPTDEQMLYSMYGILDG